MVVLIRHNAVKLVAFVFGIEVAVFDLFGGLHHLAVDHELVVYHPALKLN